MDIVGLNYYYNNQWIVGTGEFLPWANDWSDPRWQPLRALFMQVYQRYRRPMVLSETSHPGEDRPLWIRYVAGEVAAVLGQNIPLWGVCLYPIIDRPDWDHLTPWHQSGLWDAEFPAGQATNQPPNRVLNLRYADALLEAQAFVVNVQADSMPLTGPLSNL
jgi:hypothetical protein